MNTDVNCHYSRTYDDCNALTLVPEIKSGCHLGGESCSPLSSFRVQYLIFSVCKRDTQASIS